MNHLYIYFKNKLKISNQWMMKSLVKSYTVEKLDQKALINLGKCVVK